MSGFVEQLMLAEKAAENIYFAKINRELIQRLHRRMQVEQAEKGAASTSSPVAPTRRQTPDRTA